MNLDMTLREFFELADRMGAATQTIRDAQALLGARGPSEVGTRIMAGEQERAAVDAASVVRSAAGVLRSTPQPNPNPVDPPEGIIARGKTGVEIIAERQREEIRKRAEARGEVVELDPKLGLVDAEALAVKARLQANREQAEREALAKMTPEERKEFGA